MSGEYLFNIRYENGIHNIYNTEVIIYCPGKTDADGNNIPDADENNSYENWNENWAYGIPTNNIKWNESMPAT